MNLWIIQLTRNLLTNNEQYFLRIVTWRCTCKIYGQLCNPSKNNKETRRTDNPFLKIAEKHNLCFKRSKCDFNIEEILILGVVVGRRQVQMEIDKVKVVKEWKTSTKLKEVKSFLRFANFYKQFIKNFSYIVKPLNKLKEKKNWKWEEEH